MVSNTLIHGVVIAILAVLLIAAAMDDLRSFRIPTHVVVGIAALYPAHVLSSPQSVPWVMALIFSAIIFAVGFGFYAIKEMGGGDVKLMAAVALWAAPNYLMTFLIITLVVAMLLAFANAFRAASAESRATQKFSVGATVANLRHVPIFKMQIPYGVGIAAGGLYVAARLLTGQG
jgi:prepilin peptidase CpaA